MTDHVEDHTADDQDPAQLIVARAMRRFERFRRQIHAQTDRLFARLLVVEWIAAIGIALWVSPLAWEGASATTHPHVYAAVGLGLAIVSFPVALVLLRPGAAYTRHAVAVAQMLVSALLIHLTGGRIETHFHIFGSLAFLAFYLDWKVLLTAALTTTADHALRGAFLPHSIYGVDEVQQWRFVEHAGWVVFCVAFLAYHGEKTLRRWLAFAEEGGMLEAMAEAEWRATSVLERERAERLAESRTS